jgi:ABC-type nitrate/sulfonate/bicarbonate transport system substrate-binding protein
MVALKAIWFVPPVIAGAADRAGFSAAAGVIVEGAMTRSSDEQFEALRDGRMDAAVTAMDNVILWNQRPGGGDLRIVAQIEANTGISLFARPEFGSTAELAGRRLLVDSPHKGFVVVLRAMLADAGVDWADCEILEAGGVKERFDQLASGAGDATLLGPPFAEMAEAQGLRRLCDADAAYPGFPGQGLVVRQSLIDARGAELTAWLGALERAREVCLADPAATAAALAAGGLPQPVAKRLAGFISETLLPSREGVDLLLGQRRRLGLPGGDETYDNLVDLRPLRAATTKETSE